MPLANVDTREVRYEWQRNYLVRTTREWLSACSNNHPYTPETTRIDARGVACRLCQRDADARRGKGQGTRVRV